MSVLFKKYKRIFRHNLQPVFAVLVAKKNQMDADEWVSWVHQTLAHVQKNPVEYLGEDLPDRSLQSDIMEEIQKEFFKEMHAFQHAAKMLRS